MIADEKNIQVLRLKASLIICILLNTFLTILKELSHPVKLFLSQIFGNNWVGHIIIIVLLFPLILILLKWGKINPQFNFNRALQFSITLSVILLVFFYCTQYSWHTD
jgi:hypothetical protein